MTNFHLSIENLEKRNEVKTSIEPIYPIFCKRAQTSYARTQVELAQYQYL